jgi:hypothetical protein
MITRLSICPHRKHRENRSQNRVFQQPVRSDIAISDTLRRGICGSTPFVEDISKLLVSLDITLLQSRMPEMLKPETKYSNKKELVFSKLDGGIMVATAGGDSVARGETIQLMHLSEVASLPRLWTFAETSLTNALNLCVCQNQSR